MKIRRLEIQGFKSFADRTVLKFGEGITGVVGPNGCGKSNIVDAIRWVMGEQSAKHLRGAGMQDVIFAGSERRGPSGVAEVTLSFKNDGGLVPDEYRRFDEISITRRLFRDGTSEYAINRVPCRLRDILDLFMGTGVGKNAYSIIEQGRIGLIVTAKPEDRRAVIEDAAGVSRYKARRKQAERRIEATEQNLLRVKDITDELAKRLASLERQAKKAERYKRLKEELRGLDLHAAAHRYLDLTVREQYELDNIERLRASIQAVEAAISGDEEAIMAALESLGREEEALRLREAQLHEHQQALAISQNNVESLTREVRKLDARYTEAADERAALVEELDRVRVAKEEAESLNARLQSTGGDETETLAVREEALAALNLQIEEAQADLEREKQAVVETLTSIAQYRSNQINLERAGTDLNARIGRVLGTKKVTAQRLRQATKRKKEVLEELQIHRARRAELETQRAEGEATLEVLRSERTSTEALLSSTRQTLMTKRSRLGSLLEIQRNYEGCNDAVRSIMKQSLELPARDRGPLGLVADFVSADPRYEAAVEAVLGDRLQYVVVPSQEDSVASIEYLKQSAQGRSSFIPLDLREDHVSWAPRPSSRRPPSVQDSKADVDTGGNEAASEMIAAEMGGTTGLPIPETVDSAFFDSAFSDSAFWMGSGDDLWPPMDAPGVVGRMVDLVRATPGYEHVARVLLGDVVVVEGLDEARHLWRENGHRKTLVTLSGEVLDPVGVLAGGSSDGISSGMLAQKREIKELTTDVSLLGATAQAAEERHVELKARVDELERSVRQCSKDIHQADLTIVSLEQAEKKLLAETQREAHEIRAASEDLAAMREKRASLAAERDSAKCLVEELEARRSVLDGVVQTRVTAVDGLRSRARTLSDEVTELKVTVAANAERRENAARNVERLLARVTDLEARQDRLAEVERSSREEKDRLLEKIVEAEKEGLALTDVVEVERNSVTEDREHLESEQRTLRQRESEVRAQRRRVDEDKTSLNESVVRVRELQIARDNLEQRTLERYRLSAKDVVTDHHLSPLQAPELAHHAEKLRGQIDRIGPINLTAIEEYAEVNTRYEFLSAQKKDLEEAIASLRTAIRKINKTSRERYLEAFRLVNEKFQQVFPRLFNGGAASLVMLDESDPLESGIEMMAQPPGKKLQSVTLLSGGEKALTAVALIFSIFLVKPTPFCLLDEVDAPLDEANVGRYNDMVQDMSSIAQFILITHNKKTMELPDRLYGVTMEDPGVSKIVPVDVIAQERPLRAVS